MNKLNPNDKVIIEQLFESIKVYIRQFKKTPNLQIARLIKTKKSHSYSFSFSNISFTLGNGSGSLTL